MVTDRSSFRQRRRRRGPSADYFGGSGQRYPPLADPLIGWMGVNKNRAETLAGESTGGKRLVYVQPRMQGLPVVSEIGSEEKEGVAGKD